MWRHLLHKKCHPFKCVDETVNFAFIQKNYFLVNKHRKVNFVIFHSRFMSSNFAAGACVRTRTYPPAAVDGATSGTFSNKSIFWANSVGFISAQITFKVPGEIC